VSSVRPIALKLLCVSLLSGMSAAFAGTPPVTTPHVFAAPQISGQPATPPVGGPGQVLLALLVVLAAVFAVAWVMRRMRGFGSRVGGAIDVLAEVPLGQKERAILLQVGPTQILLGVAPGRVNTLHVLAEPLDLGKPVVSSAEIRPSFKALMLRSLGK
jgi:flagellar protein FliO/FliZ